VECGIAREKFSALDHFAVVQQHGFCGQKTGQSLFSIDKQFAQSVAYLYPTAQQQQQQQRSVNRSERIFTSFLRSQPCPAS
jgi:hypothetical protein